MFSDAAVYQAWIRIVFLIISFVFSLSLIICLIYQILKDRPGFNSGFFRIFLVSTFSIMIVELDHSTVNLLPTTGLFPEFFKGNQEFLCGRAYLFASFMYRGFIIGQNFLALNRFSAVFMPFKYEQIWKTRNVCILIVLIYITAFILISPTFFSSFHKYVDDSLGSRTFGPFQNTDINLITNHAQGYLFSMTAVICFTLCVSTVIKLKILEGNGQITADPRQEIPLLVYTIILNVEEIALAVCYQLISNTKFFGGSISEIVFGWVAFTYLCTPPFYSF